jgi:SNF2 family DNA or RNA helicase
MILWLKEGSVTPANALVLLLRLQQIACGHVGDDQGNVREVDTAKKTLLGEILEDIDPKEKVVVFCRFRADLDAIHGAANLLDRKCAELSGRRAEFDIWRDRADVPILAAQIQSGGLGLDMTLARYGIFYSVGFSNGDYEQARARIHRPGQRGRATYYHLLTENTVDGKVYKALAEKRDAARAILEDL